VTLPPLDTGPEAARVATDTLAGCTSPWLLGVRHHSPACAAAIPALLDGYAPDALFVELPAELETWLPWLGHEGTVAPVALALVAEDGGRDLGFYPFANFSPELAAIRWAVRRGIPVHAFDLPHGEREHERADHTQEGSASTDSPLAALERTFGATSVETLWDRLVEAFAPSQEPEAIRRAGLAFGWFLRVDAAATGAVRRHDRLREGYMRHRLATAKGRVAAVVGAFHAPALLPSPLPALGLPEPYVERPRRPSVSSLVPYAFDLLDSRSGYPAGIRDPLWQERVHTAAVRKEPLVAACHEVVVAVARAVRAERHVAGVPDAAEAVRIAMDLAMLRGLPGPGRRELIEAIESAFGRGEPLGRGRVLARALEAVLVGRKRGKLAPGTPRSGLVPHVEELLGALGLPRTIDERPKRRGERVEPTVLDPLRSPLDARRHVTFERLAACSVPYATTDDRALNDTELLTARWRVEWTPATEAMLELAGVRGVTLAQAAEGAIRAMERGFADRGGASAEDILALLDVASRAALTPLVREYAASLVAPARGDEVAFLYAADLPALARAVALVDRIASGHVPGLTKADVADHALLPVNGREALIAAAVRAVEGLAGSDRLEDVRALLGVVELLEADAGGRLGVALDDLARSGSPLMQGAGGAALVLVGRRDAAAFGVEIGSWIDAGGERLADRVRGALVLAAPVLESEPEVLAPLVDRIDALGDDTFLARLPDLRDGFDALSPAGRARFLEVVGARLPDAAFGVRGALDDLATDPVMLARFAAADREGARAVEVLGLGAAAAMAPGPRAPTETPAHAPAAGERAISLLDRFRLLLGRERDRLGPSALPAGLALDELYGRGRGEGSRGDLLAGGGGGAEAPYPSVRVWAEELRALFGDRVREEVLGRASARGVGAAMLELDPSSVRPSVELLENVLALRGGLAEADLSHFRRLVSRIVEELVKELATRLAPALAGLVTPRPSRRPVGPLDLRRTVARNMHTARKRADGTHELTPDRLVWKTRSQRALDWHVVLVVDVSGSMEASVIYSALMAAILSAIPAVTVRFLAFNTHVMDLSDRVSDPLGLLLEVAVGGGTFIGPALRYARGLLAVPSRSIVVTVTDFEEGGSVNELVAEARALVESGCKALGLAALDDTGAPRYHRGIAELVAGAGMPVAALTPLELARWIGEKIR